MSLAAGATVHAPARPTGLPTRLLATALLWFAVFLGGFVLFEPAPYELFLALLIPAWMLSGLRIARAVGPLIVMMVLFLVGGLLAATQAKEFSNAADLLRRYRLPRLQLVLLRLLDR